MEQERYVMAAIPVAMILAFSANLSIGQIQSGQQSATDGAGTSIMANSFNETVRTLFPIPDVNRLSPTQKRQRTAQALALRDEVSQFKAENGGTLTPQQQSYVKRKYHRIVGIR
jgi:hypothetical protein